MAKYVAFLRGINVGGRIIKMAELKPCVEKLGFTNVVTVLQTGNIILESKSGGVADVREKLETGIGKQFNYEARALVYTAEELASIVDAYPFDQSDTDKHDYIIFMANDMAKEFMRSTPQTDTKNEQIALGKEIIYWNVTKGMTLDSMFAKQSMKVIKRGATTTRNINTLNKILRKAQ